MTVHFVTANVNAVVKAIPDSTHVIFWTAVNSTTSETINVVSWPGETYNIPDGGFVWSEHILGMELVAGSNYEMATFQSVGATQCIAKKWPYSYLSAQRSSDVVWGGTKDGGDYTNSTSLLPGFATTGAYYYGPDAVVVRQTGTLAPVCFIIGDSIAYGNGNLAFSGTMGAALTAAGIAFEDAGLGGITSLNLSKYGGGCIFSLCQYCDHVLVSLGTNDLAVPATVAQLQGYYLSVAQQATAYGADITWLSIPPRTTTTDNWATYTNQTLVSFSPQIQTINNWFRDTSANGAQAYFNANLNTLGSYSGYFMDVCQAIEKSSAGATPTFTATTYTWTITAPSTPPAFLSTYKDANNTVYTVGPSVAGETILYTTILTPGPAPAASGQLQNVSGTGDATLTYSAVTISSANQMMFGTGGRWITDGVAFYPTPDGIHIATALNTLTAPYITGTGSPFANLNTTLPMSVHP
jgi:hypothetical protein